MATFRIPPNGFGGFSQATPAAQMMQLGAGLGRAAPATRRRRKKKATATTTRRRKKTTARRTTKRTTKRPARLVKGSAAAKAYMAKIRRKRRR